MFSAIKKQCKQKRLTIPGLSKQTFKIAVQCKITSPTLKGKAVEKLCIRYDRIISIIHKELDSDL